MQVCLRAADDAVRAVYDALAPDQRTDPWTGEPNASFSRWAGASKPHACWRPNVAHHAAGAAIDVEPEANLRIVTRDGVPPGDEPVEIRAERQRRVLAVYDRAVRFMTPSVATADVRARQPGESTLSVWTRFKAVSDALASYLSFAIDAGASAVSRAAIDDPDERSDDEMLSAIPATERADAGDAVARLEQHLGSAEFRASHDSWPNNPHAQYLRMLRDYELVRTTMAGDCADVPPMRTANPARGFLHLRSEIVTALCDQGLRWGACDLGLRRDGSTGNGAMMHFDLADDGGYPDIHSLLRFG